MSDHNPLVSVIVPNFNHAEFLQQRLDSIYNQTYQLFEVVLLDDCSTDASLEILKKYQSNEKTAQLIVNEVNSGSPFRQWQKGLEIANGELIWIAESDDWAEEWFLEKMVNQITSEVGLAYCRSWTYHHETNDLDSWFYADGLDEKRWKSDFVNNGQHEVENYLIFRNTIPNASACLFKKELAEFLPAMLEMKYCGDWMFWANMLAKTDLAFVSEPLNYYRHSQSTTRATKSNEQEKQRYDEYFRSIELITSLCRYEKTLEINNYNWIIDNLYENPSLISFLFLKKPPLPISHIDFIKYNLIRALNSTRHRLKDYFH